MLALFSTSDGTAYEISNSNWVGFGAGGGANDRVQAMAVTDSGHLLIGGYFTEVGGIAANHIARWDGVKWLPLGEGVDGPVLSIAVMGDIVIVGGAFATAGGIPARHIAKWDGRRWSSLGAGMDGAVHALAGERIGLFAGGAFRNAGALGVNGIATWDGRDWSALGAGIGGYYDGNYVAALAASGSNVYAGGFFARAGEVFTSCFARWDGTAWRHSGGVGGELPRVFAMAGCSSNLFVGGQFRSAGGVTASNVARLSGGIWAPLGNGLNGSVAAMAVRDGELFAGGAFTIAGGRPANYIARWTGSNWLALGSGVNGYVYALAVTRESLFVGGGFTAAGGMSYANVARVSLPVHDLAVVKIRAPRTVVLSKARPVARRRVLVTIQNRSDHAEWIEPATLGSLVSLSVQSLDPLQCPHPAPATLDVSPEKEPFWLRPGAMLNVPFRVSFDCAVDPLPGNGRDVRYVARVDHAAIDGISDTHPSCDDCPRAPATDWNSQSCSGDGAYRDRGCGAPLTGRVLGADVVTDIIVK